MHKFIRSLALLALIPAIPTSVARAGTADTRTTLISNTPGVDQQDNPNLLDPSGISSTTTSPLWVSSEGPGIATIDKDAGGTISGAPMAAGAAIPAGARRTANPPGIGAGSSGSLLDGPKMSFALAHSNGPDLACVGGGGASAAPGAGNGLLGIFPADPRPISAGLGVIAVGSLAAAVGWKLRRRLAPGPP